MDIIKKYAEYVITERNLSGFEGKLKITWFGVATLLFDDGTTKIMFDGMVTRPSIPGFLFTKLKINKRLVHKIIQKYHLEDLQAMFISHSHYDHVMDAPEFAARTGADIYGSKSTCNIARGYTSKGMSPSSSGVEILEENIHCFQHGECYEIGDFKITVLASKHSKTSWYNDDLGVEITEPLPYPSHKKKYTEGGSFDFYIEHGNQKILIRPSCNYIIDSLNDISADILFLGIGQLSKMSMEEKEIFYRETVGKIQPKLIIPVHWENFFIPLRRGCRAMPVLLDKTDRAMQYMVEKTEKNNIAFRVLPVLKSVKL